MIHYSLTSKKGFSIIVALATTGILLVIVAGIATLALGEMRLTRLLYDDILTENRAEWAFEYAMLKVKNHREGFADTMSAEDIDAVLFSGSTDWTRTIKTSYTIEANTGSAIFTLWENSHLIVPLFTANSTALSLTGTSKDPRYSPWVNRATTLTLDTNWADISWSIVAMSGSESVSLAWSGEIDGNEAGTMRLRGEECFSNDWSRVDCNDLNQVAESLQYFYDRTGSVSDFLGGGGKFAGMSITDPYLMIFNNGTEANVTISTPGSLYALPTLTVTALSEKAKSRKILRFTEDKSRYYDALKYGVYNNE